jgi:predicted  nucleic acid-binding Zn ribbon protein
MLVALVSFRVDDGSRGAAAEPVNDLLSCWYKNGQVTDTGWLVANRGERLDAIVRIPEASSLDRAHNNIYGERALSKLLPVVPVVEILGPEPDSAPTCTCSARSALVLFTTYLSTCPPVRCLDCFGAVPLYRLPHVHDHEHLVILQWAADYRACDTLQMHCTTGERFGEYQLSDPSGSLSQNGRRLAAELERLSGTPVYYYLHKMRSRGRVSELRRACPACNSPWRLERPVHAFEFRCDPCRLLSAVASDAA